MEATLAVQPHQLFWSIANSCVTSRALHLIAEVDLASHLEPQTATGVADLAQRCGVDATSLARVLRLLSAHGIFAIDGDQVSHTGASLLLREDAPHSLRAFTRLNGLPTMWSAIGALDHSLRTGAPAMQALHPGGFFGYLADNPHDAAVFNAAMEGRAQDFARSVVDTYDFTPFQRVVDVAGGYGQLLHAVLEAAPHADGVLFELPAVAAAVPATQRLSVIGGDFFADPLPPGDAYLLMEILHDWPDDEAVEIVSAIRRACRPGAVLLVIENVVLDGPPDPRVHNLDVLMLIITGGRERTAAELRELLGSAGFQLSSITETQGPMRIVEAVAI